MRRWIVALLILAVLASGVAACLLLAAGTTWPHKIERGETAAAAASAQSEAEGPTQPPLSATFVPTNTPRPPTFTPTQTPPPPTGTPTATPTDLYITAEDVFWHPDPQLYSGDVVSFEVLVHDGAGVGLNNLGVALFLGTPAAESQLAFSRLAPAGVGRRLQATFTWVWDTTGLTGPQTLTVWVDPNDEVQIGDEDPDNNLATFAVDIRPAAERPAVEAGMAWVTTESDCCVFYYLTSSAAARDIDLIIRTAEEAVAYDEAFLGVEHREKIEFNLVNRVVGHGGFASDSITISYLDRNYVGGELVNTIRHEVSHMLDRQLSMDRPILITEGLAVYVAGGHFKSEPIESRMAAAEAAGLTIPLTELADNFYPAQHELSYMQASAFVDYLIDTYGWEGFRTFLSTVRFTNSQSAMIDASMRQIFDQGLGEVEAAWLQDLRVQSVDAAMLADVETTIAFYDTARRYQQTLDPAAYFLTAWIPSVAAARERQLVADYTRHPTAPENIALELMLSQGYDALVNGDYEQSQEWIAAVNGVLDSGVDFDVHPLARRIMHLTQVTLADGYEPQVIDLTPEQATITAIETWPELVELEFQLVVTSEQ